MQSRWRSFQMEKAFPQECFGIKQTDVVECGPLGREPTKNKCVRCFVPNLLMCPLLRVPSGCVMNSPTVLARVEEIYVFVICLRGLSSKRHFEIDSHIHFLLRFLLIQVLDVEWVLHSSKIQILILIPHVGHRNFLLQFRRSAMFLY
jgi:hypothetical protein